MSLSRVAVFRRTLVNQVIQSTRKTNVRRISSFSSTRSRSALYSATRMYSLTNTQKRTFYYTPLLRDLRDEDDKPSYPGLSSSSQTEKDKVKATLREYVPASKADRLAVELFTEAGQYEGAIKQVFQDISHIDSIIQSDLSLGSIFKEDMPETERKQEIDELLSDIKLHPITASTLEFLQQSKKLDLIPTVYPGLKILMDLYLNRVQVKLSIAPTPEVNQAYIDSLVSNILATFPSDVTPTMHIEMDPKLIKGYKVVVGEELLTDTSELTVLDAEVQTKIDALNAKIAYLKRWKETRNRLDIKNPHDLDRKYWDWVLAEGALFLPAKAGASGVAGATFDDEENSERMKTVAGIYKYATEQEDQQ